MLNVFKEVTIETANYTWSMDDNGDWNWSAKTGAAKFQGDAINELLNSIAEEN